MSGPNRATRRAMAGARRKLPCTGPRGPLVDRSVDIAAIEGAPPRGLERVLENGTYLVQDCARADGWRVLMICRRDGREGISWDDLAWLKDAAGYADREAVELYPRTGDVVNVANMRHLWILPPGTWMPYGLDKNPNRSGRR